MKLSSFYSSGYQDFPPALNALGFYEVNTRQNYSGAAAYFKRAADKGDRDGLTNLAVSYDNGWVEGHPPDKVKAVKKMPSDLKSHLFNLDCLLFAREKRSSIGSRLLPKDILDRVLLWGRGSVVACTWTGTALWGSCKKLLIFVNFHRYNVLFSMFILFTDLFVYVDIFVSLPNRILRLDG